MNYYHISRLNNRVFAEIKEDNMKYSPLCFRCKRPGDRLLPLSISFKDEKPLGDFTWLAPDLFISKKCKTVLEKLKSKDFRFEEIQILGERQENIWHLNVISKCIFSPQCNVELLEECAHCGIKIYSTWDDGIKVDSSCGAGFLRLEEHRGMVFVNEEIKNYLITESLTNIEFTRSEVIEDQFAYLRPRKS